MKLFKEESIYNFKAWSGAVDTQKRIIEENKEDEFEQLMDALYPDGLDETQLNDILWFEEDWIFEQLGIEEESELEF